MPVKHNTSDINGVYVGTALAQKMYCGTTLVWAAVDLVSQNVLASGGTAANATSRIQLTSSGNQNRKVGSGAYSTDNVWLNGGPGALYDVRFTNLGSSGSGATGGTFGSWLGLGLDREVTALASAPGDTFEVTVQVELRLNSSGAVLATETCTLTSDRF